jgi:hypothetical protein
MPPDMRVQTTLLKGVFSASFALIAAAFLIPEARAQALLVERLPGGTQLVLVNQPLADATTLVWPEVSDDREAVVVRLTVGRLTIAADVEAAFGAAQTEGPPAPVPAVIVAVGGASADELSSLLERVLGDRPAASVVLPSPPVLVEGGLDRRLGAPGSEALLRFELLLPPPGDARRSSVEVLWDLVPQLLSDTIPILQSRVEDDRGVLEGRVDAEIAEITVSDLRLQLARIASDPNLQADDVAEARRRLQVRRYAALEEHPDAAVKVLERWLSGGEGAVRELVFGTQAVTIQSVREAAAEWLPTHPGHAQLILPPRVFNPRFAVGPQIHQLGNDLTAAILERASAPVSVVVLRPVVVPDFDGEVTATVLARLARELRSAESRPGFVRVRTDPPLIEVAGPADGFGELLEQLTGAYVAVVSDRAPVTTYGDDARRRALDLMAGLLGVTEAEDPSPAALLRAGNLALGVVATDAEAAAEALGKFWAVESRDGGATDVQSVPAVPRTRVAAAGDESVLVVALETEFGGNEAVSMVLRELLETRAGALWPDSRVEVLRPYVPGRSLLLVEVAADETVDGVERAVVRKWSSLISGAGEAELAPVKRRVAAAASAEMSGVAGHARLCAATAAGASRWRQPAEFELEVLTVDVEMINLILKRFSDFSTLETTGAGVLLITELQGR